MQGSARSGQISSYEQSSQTMPDLWGFTQGHTGVGKTMKLKVESDK